ncbi:hypothetical protein PM082_007378 [Marasmius tenuissimus]|nr:hypothetical protein PM082_007378 [Marasmius tenuissimus]
MSCKIGSATEGAQAIVAFVWSNILITPLLRDSYSNNTGLTFKIVFLSEPFRSAAWHPAKILGVFFPVGHSDTGMGAGPNGKTLYPDSYGDFRACGRDHRAFEVGATATGNAARAGP